MNIFQFTKEIGKRVTQFDSDFVMARIMTTETPLQIGCIYLEAGGIIGHHEAVVPQLLLILNGEGKVLGKENRVVNVKQGDAVFWQKREGHKTTSESDLTAIGIEGEELNPGLYLTEREFN